MIVEAVDDDDYDDPGAAAAVEIRGYVQSITLVQYGLALSTMGRVCWHW